VPTVVHSAVGVDQRLKNAVCLVVRTRIYPYLDAVVLDDRHISAPRARLQRRNQRASRRKLTPNRYIQALTVAQQPRSSTTGRKHCTTDTNHAHKTNPARPLPLIDAAIYDG
jgi:hypothetical protein